MATQLPSTPGPRTLGGLPVAGGKLLFGLAVAGGLLSALLILWAIGSLAVAAGFLAGFVALVSLLFLARQLYPPAEAAPAGTDWSLTREAAENDGVAIAITDRAGRLVCANDLYGVWFAGFPAPPSLPIGESGIQRLAAAGRAAWRDGVGRADDIARDTIRLQAEIVRGGRVEDYLVWRFRPALSFDIAAEARRLITGQAGERLGESGVMAVLIGSEGRIRSANRSFALRSTGRAEAAIEGRDFVSLLASDKQGQVRFEREGVNGNPLRLLQVPLDRDSPDSPTLVFLIDDDDAPRMTGSGGAGHVQTLLSMLPIALALADRDGRFLFLNKAFARAAGVAEGSIPVYPGDLVVREDQAAVADMVRRFGAGKGMSGDMQVRLRNRADEAVSLSVAGARGLGEAAVLLSLKDNSEENRLKRQVAQATKMQAVGQLAGGVAHDFNNILTAIIGHCDLMLMRHTPGDSDYDDIQQIKANSNRAASLTRQLLAFSRQQTLRPQILQLPDVISEVFALLKRLLGETVQLAVKHGRDLGAVRADPGQLEQVIVNLAVNARDAMLAKDPNGGGTLTLQTYAVSTADVRKMGSDILPVADYTALRVTDTGSGIPADLLPKIFEPFFTTKEVGKGTGLGLSTVYGIVKQSGGFIFADSKEGEGTSFEIYLPVHEVEAVAAAPVREKERPAELWGSGTILLVEDEDMVRAVAERALTRHGYKVLTAAHGEEALELLDDSVDLLVSDVVMPTMDGPALVRQARTQYPELPVLFMSGYAEEQLRKSIAIDNVGFLPKPFSVQQLAEAARAALEPK